MSKSDHGYLHRSNERLRELEAAYRDAPFGHHFWKDFPATIDVARFRDSPHYLGQETYKTREYRASFEHARAAHPTLLKSLCEDDAFGCCTLTMDGVVVSRDLLDSIQEIAFMRRLIGPLVETGCLLDVGAGYGRLAHRLCTLYPDARVYCTDAIALSTFVCEYYLWYRQVINAQTVPFHELHKIPTVDIASNVHSWSECTLDAIDYWLDVIDKREARYLVLVPHRVGATHAPPVIGELISNDGRNYWPSIERVGFKLAHVEPKFPHGVDGFEPTNYYLFERRS